MSESCGTVSASRPDAASGCFRWPGAPPALVPPVRGRLRLSRAAWWMGLLRGLPVLTVGLIPPDARSYLTRSLAAFGVVAATALVVGLGGLAYGCATEERGFAWVGVMHNFSYLCE